MSSIVLSSAGLQIPPGPGPQKAQTPPGIPAAALRPETPGPSTQLTLGKPADLASAVYAKPQTQPSTRQAWSGPSNDRISNLMLQNFNAQKHGLLNQSRGLGRLLLEGFAIGQTNYRQTFSSYAVTDTHGSSDAARTQELLALDTARLTSSRVSMQIQTRSGQTVQLQIAFKNGLDGQNAGLHVEAKSSGQLSDSERKAIAQLAEGFESVLTGLAQGQGPRLDLAGIMAFDKSVLASLSLTVKDYATDAGVQSFALQLSDKQRTLNLRQPQRDGVSELSLNLNPATPMLGASLQQRQSAIAQILQQLDASAQRSHAADAQLALFKQAFTQLQELAPPSPSNAAAVNKLDAMLQRQVPALLSGLMDYQGSFSGDFERRNSKGLVNEQGQARHEISQTTTLQKDQANGTAVVLQKQSEKVSAQYLRARNDATLEPENGNYDSYDIQDQTTRTTQIAAADGKLTQAQQSTDINLQRKFTSLADFKVQEQRTDPVRKQLVQQLL
ncbi:hypothetical protein [Comamonas sp. GB3 AK4-5]|uniref:hypothetical protein n=1 Tax=Comamonas sp. GB3 AK4-5 TaxID=3231487 RepID=UPI00351E690C